MTFAQSFNKVTHFLTLVTNDIKIYYAPPIMSLAQLLALLGVFFIILKNYNEAIREGKAFEPHKYANIFIITFALMFYQGVTAVPEFFARLTQNYIKEGTQNLVQKKYKTNISIENIYELIKVGDSIAIATQANEEAKKKTDPTFSKINVDGNWLERSLYDLIKYLSDIIIGIIGYTASIIVTVMNFYYSMYFNIEKIILFILGPLALGISLIPVYKNSAMSWFNAYFLVNMAQVVADIFLTLFHISMAIIINNMAEIKKTYENTILGAYSAMGQTLLMLILYMIIISIMVFLFIALIGKSENYLGRVFALDSTAHSADLSNKTGAVAKNMSGATKKILTKGLK